MYELTSKTPEKRRQNATFRVQGSGFFPLFLLFLCSDVQNLIFLASTAARFLETFLKTNVCLSRLGRFFVFSFLCFSLLIFFQKNVFLELFFF